MFLFCFSSRSSRGAGSENIYAFGHEACLKTQLMSVGCCPLHLPSSTFLYTSANTVFPATRTHSQTFCWAPVRNLRVDKSHKVCTASYPDPPACFCCFLALPSTPYLPPPHSPCHSSTFFCSNSLSPLPTSSWDTAVALTRPVFQ